MTIEEKEKKKYQDIWKMVNYTSGSASNFADFVKKLVPEGSVILEIGCGNGTVMQLLLKKYIDKVFGTDITIDAALKNGVPELFLYEKPVWNLTEYPYFLHDYTISTDVLEHIPSEKVDQSIKAIIHCTRVGTIHAICTRPASTKYNGEQVHLTVKPIWWWRKKFKEHNTKGVEVILIDTKEL